MVRTLMKQIVATKAKRILTDARSFYSHPRTKNITTLTTV